MVVQCTTVCMCRTFPTAIAVGSDEATQSAGRVQIYEYNEHSRSVLAVTHAAVNECNEYM